ncbi:MAG: potassium-transporting ATPase subunit KdpC [Reyranella sp.]|jgi:K+-transporting ATPase ATPase C chain|uniref:potassium-transporting ATPase subunit KdpC n=1 Tax=Reyranella sp. TaxID=1929291 RepID=UPI0025D2B910|nr:potassium-transporting ATPase subunit KdpC [Reyranella sp.]MBR2818500.1 potassium-transporting ATPase subunit KdpC [Reyranella sp.]
MLRHFRASIVMLLSMTVLLGLAYPLAMVALTGAVFPSQANGSLIVRDGKVIGSTLIGQNFTGEGYFHGRPSATVDTDPADATKTVSAPYNAANSSGSNLGPTSKALIDRVKEDADKLGKGVPVELVTTSGSGLDPHLSPAAAAWQVARVAKARNMPEADVQRLVAQHTEGRMYGLLGEPRVNVLQLNLALDAQAKR